MNKISFLFITFFYCQFLAQQSKSSFYPLNVGDYWEYRVLEYSVSPIPDTSFFSREVVDEIILPNGKKYSKILEYDNIHYERFDTTTNEIKFYKSGFCSGTDKSAYSLNYHNDSTVVWRFCDLTDHFITFVDSSKSFDSSRIHVDFDGLWVENTVFQNNLGLKSKHINEGGLYVQELIVAKINGKYWRKLTDVRTQESMVDGISLNQNYPNPFNPSTTIKYNIPNPSADGEKRETKNVKLLVYDVLGEIVETLVNEKQKPGSYEMKWDGSELTSGIYFYRLQVGDYVETKKMILLK